MNDVDDIHVGCSVLPLVYYTVHTYVDVFDLGALLVPLLKVLLKGAQFLGTGSHMVKLFKLSLHGPRGVWLQIAVGRLQQVPVGRIEPCHTKCELN